ncbi:MAG: hydrogenase maturation protease [Cyanobacteria bacterium P01_D01_bin.36]
MLANTLTHPVRSVAARSQAHCSFLIIGCGNVLRGDDAVGAQVARTIINWHLPNVKAIAVHQLTPELSIEIAQANYVIFVDACREGSHARNIQLSPVSASLNGNQSPTQSSRSLTHSHSVEGLLALTQKVYEHTPQAWLLQVPTESFDFGEQLSSIAQRGSDKAVQTIERFLINYQVPYS